MDSRSTTLFYIVLGTAILVTAVAITSPAGHYPVDVEFDEVDDPPAGAEVVRFASLPEVAQDPTGHTDRPGGVELDSFEDHAAIETLQERQYVRKDGDVYEITVSPRPGGPFDYVVRQWLLAFGGLVLGTASYAAIEERWLRLGLAAVPAGAVAGVVVVNSLVAPMVWYPGWPGDVAFGLAASVPLLVGLAAGRFERGPLRVAGGTFLLAHVEGTLWNAATNTFLALVAFGVPGYALGWVVGENGP